MARTIRETVASCGVDATRFYTSTRRLGSDKLERARKKRWKQLTRKFSRHASSASASSSAGSAKNTAAPTAGWRETGLKPASANGRAERLEISKRESSHNSSGNWA